MTKSSAIVCDAMKAAYRQSRDGYVVSFVIHPQDMPAVLANSDIGSQWQLSLVPLDDDGNAEQQPKKELSHDHKLLRRIGILCGDPVFARFMVEDGRARSPDEEEIAAAVRAYCGVRSRTEIIPGSPAKEKWDRLEARFQAGLVAPRVGAK